MFLVCLRFFFPGGKTWMVAVWCVVKVYSVNKHMWGLPQDALRTLSPCYLPGACWPLPFPGWREGCWWVGFKCKKPWEPWKQPGRPSLRVPVYLAAHSLGTSNFPALRKQVLLSALSQRKFISVSSGKRKVSMEEKSLYGRDVPVCVFIAKTWKRHYIFSFRVSDKYSRFKTGEIAGLPSNDRQPFMQRFHPFLS